MDVDTSGTSSGLDTADQQTDQSAQNEMAVEHAPQGVSHDIQNHAPQGVSQPAYHLDHAPQGVSQTAYHQNHAPQGVSQPAYHQNHAHQGVSQPAYHQSHAPQGVSQPAYHQNHAPQGVSQPAYHQNHAPQGVSQPAYHQNHAPQGVSQPGYHQNHAPQGVSQNGNQHVQPQNPSQHRNPQQEFQVIVKNHFDSKNYPFMVTKATTVEELKNKIRDRLPGQIPNDQQRLTYAGQNLVDNKKTMADYHVKAEATILLTGKLRGGQH